MKIIWVNLVLIVLSLFVSANLKKPFIKNQEESEKTQPTQNGSASPSRDVGVHKGSDISVSKVDSQTEKDGSKSDSNQQVYSVQIVSQPAKTIDWPPIVSICISGFAALLAVGTLLFNIRQRRADQRAWIGVKNIFGNLEIGKPYDITIHLINSGKTPAIDVSTIHTGDSVPKGQKVSFSHGDVQTTPTVSLIIPGADQFIRKHIVDEVLQDHAAGIVTGGTPLRYLWDRHISRHLQKETLAYFLFVSSA